MLILNIIIILFFIGLGIAFALGKGMDLIAGYNTMSKEEKEKIDEKALCKHMSILMYLLAGCWGVLSVGIEINRTWLFWVGFALFIGVCIFYVIYMNTNNRIKK